MEEMTMPSHSRGARLAILAILGGLVGCKPANDEQAAPVGSNRPEVGVITLHRHASTTFGKFPGRVVASFTAGIGSDERAAANARDLIFVDVTMSRKDFFILQQEIDNGRVKVNGSAVAVGLKLDDDAPAAAIGVLKLSEADMSANVDTITVPAVFPNPDRLAPGMPVRVIVQEGFVQRSFLIPRRAIIRNKQGEAAAMFLAIDGKVEARVLSIVSGVGDVVVVVAGIRDGDRVIVEGAQRVREGEPATATEVGVNEFGVSAAKDLRESLKKGNP